MSYRFLDSTVLGSPLKNESYNIIGAGISGLMLGFFLKKKKIPFKIYEKSNRAGGLIHTDKNQFGISESAANGFLWCEEIQMMADKIGAEIISPSANFKAKFLVRNGQLHQFPFTFPEAVQLIFRVISPHFSSPQTMREFGDTYFGKIFSEQVLNPAMGGIYAADITQMSFPASLPKMAKVIDNSKWLPLAFLKHALISKKSKRKGIHSFRGGMQIFIDKLTEFLKGDIIFNSEIQDLTTFKKLSNRKENTIITTPAFVAGKYFDNEIKNMLNEVQYPSIVSSTFFFEKKSLKNFKNGFGCLIPRNEEMITLGVIFNSVIFEDRVFDFENISLTCIANAQSLFAKSENEIAEIFLNDLDKLFSLNGNKLEYKMYIHKNGIPLYTPQLYENWFKLNELLLQSHPNIRLFGNYTGQISIRGLAEQANAAVSKINS